MLHLRTGLPSCSVPLPTLRHPEIHPAGLSGISACIKVPPISKGCPTPHSESAPLLEIDRACFACRSAMHMTQAKRVHAKGSDFPERTAGVRIDLSVSKTLA